MEQLRGATGPQMMVSEISATRNDIFSIFSVFAISMKIWPNIVNLGRSHDYIHGNQDFPSNKVKVLPQKNQESDYHFEFLLIIHQFGYNCVQ